MQYRQYQNSHRHSEVRTRMNPVGSALVMAGLLLGAGGLAQAQSALPRMTIDQMQYSGAFRIPSGTYGSSSANYSYAAIGYNSTRKSIYLAGNEKEGAIAEFAVPEIVNSTRLADLKTAGAPLQAFTNVVNKASIDMGQGIRISGIFYSAGKLLVNVYRFYDLGPFLTKQALILSNASDLKGSSTGGYISTAGDSAAAGWISPIPAEMQSMLGGTHMCGFTTSTNRALAYNSSEGPAAYSFNPVAAMANNASSISTTQLMRFTLDNGMVTRDQLYNNDHTNKLWTFISEGSFGMIMPGTRTYMVLGGSGGHESGIAYGDPPYGGYKGYYALDQKDNYPYYWLFDVNDFDKVRKGQMQASAIKPYAAGKFAVPFTSGTSWNPVAGGSYDETTGTLYLSVYKADTQSGGNTPVIVTYKVGAAQARPLPPTNTTAQ
ncbi:MAG: hypothetical protein WDO72_02860 [Pseudomonadota bacterium]